MYGIISDRCDCTIFFSAGWHLDAKRLCGLHIDDDLELGGLDDW
jgi:hypothetical protein